MMESTPFFCSLFYIFILLNQTDSEQSNIYSIVRQAEQATNNASMVLVNMNGVNGTERQNDFIVRLHFILNEVNIIPYIRDVTYSSHDLYNITVEDLIELSNFREFDLDQSMDLLRKLNISADIISVKNFQQLLEIANMTFNEFFEKLKNTTNLNGQALQGALEKLSINPSDFSGAVTFGTKNDVYKVLETGAYSTQKFEEAAVLVGTDLPKFYKNVKNIILDQMKTNSFQHYIEEMSKISALNKELYDSIWTQLNLNLSDIYKVPNLRRIVDNMYNHLNENVTLGVILHDHEVVIHRIIYKKLEAVKNIVNVYVESVLYPGRIYDNLTLVKGMKDFGTLWSNNTLSKGISVETHMSEEPLENCTYMTMNDNKLIENHVEIVNVSTNCIIAQPTNGTEFYIGNPLICQEKLFGLSSMHDLERNLFAFDTFYVRSEDNIVSGTTYKRKVDALIFMSMFILVINI